MTTKPKRNPLLLIALAVVVIAGIVYYLMAAGPVIEGQQGKIIGSGPSVLAAADMATFDQMGSVAATQLTQWETEGKVALLPVGTRVLVLDVSAPRSKVRVLDTGKEYYVLTTAVGH